MPKIIFSQHAIDQMKRREISKEMVKRAINNPVGKEKSYRNRELRRIILNDKILEVPIKKEGCNIIIITAYYLDKKQYENEI